MSQVARVTLFVHDRDGRCETLPDQDLLHALLQVTPLVTRHDDGSHTFVFDMVEPEHRLTSFGFGSPVGGLATLRACGAALARAAHALGLPRTAALAESAEQMAREELCAMSAPKRRQC